MTCFSASYHLIGIASIGWDCPSGRMVLYMEGNLEAIKLWQIWRNDHEFTKYFPALSSLAKYLDGYSQEFMMC